MAQAYFLGWNLIVWKNSVHLGVGWQFCHQINDCAFTGLAPFIWATGCGAEKQKPAWRMKAQTFFFLTEMSSYVTMPGRRRPPERCAKPQACSTHSAENAVGGLPRLMELMTVIALGNLSFSLLCAFSTWGALYTYHWPRIWNATTLSGLIQLGWILLKQIWPLIFLIIQDYANVTQQPVKNSTGARKKA